MTFDKPLETWITEDVEMLVNTPKVNKEKKRVEFTQEMKTVKQKTFYSDSKPKTVICKQHVYYCVDKGKYLFNII